MAKQTPTEVLSFTFTAVSHPANGNSMEIPMTRLGSLLFAAAITSLVVAFGSLTHMIYSTVPGVPSSMPMGSAHALLVSLLAGSILSVVFSRIDDVRICNAR